MTMSNIGFDRGRITHVTRSLVPMTCMLSMAIGLSWAQESTIDVEGTRSALEQWVEIERTISREKHDLELSAEVLTQRIEMVRQETSQLREKMLEAEKSREEADKKREEMVVEKGRLDQASTSLSDMAQSLEQRTRALVARLPDPLRTKIKPLSQRLPEADQESKLTLAERFQNVVGILNEVNKFQRDIFVTSEVREISDGSSTEVTTVYLGISHAYYCDNKQEVAGMGFADARGWVWVSSNESAPIISKAIAILNNEEVASYVRLPINVE